MSVVVGLRGVMYVRCNPLLIVVGLRGVMYVRCSPLLIVVLALSISIIKRYQCISNVYMRLKTNVILCLTVPFIWKNVRHFLTVVEKIVNISTLTDTQKFIFIFTNETSCVTKTLAKFIFQSQKTRQISITEY